MKVAIFGQRAIQHKRPQLGQAQVNVLNIIAQGSTPWTDERIRQKLGLSRKGPLDRMLHGLIKRGYIDWKHKDDYGALVYSITPAGLKYLEGHQAQPV